MDFSPNDPTNVNRAWLTQKERIWVYVYFLLTKKKKKKKYTRGREKKKSYVLATQAKIIIRQTELK